MKVYEGGYREFPSTLYLSAKAVIRREKAGGEEGEIGRTKGEEARDRKASGDRERNCYCKSTDL